MSATFFFITSPLNLVSDLTTLFTGRAVRSRFSLKQLLGGSGPPFTSSPYARSRPMRRVGRGAGDEGILYARKAAAMKFKVPF
jgi:hypothetical protein